MPRVSFHTQTVIRAPVETVFHYVSDLSRHGEWASDPVQIVTVEVTPQVIGSRYRSTAQSHGVTFHSQLVVTEYHLPAQFTFVGQDSTGMVEHRFMFREAGENTHVERRMQFDVNLKQWLAFMVLLYPVRIPSARKSLQLLKEKLEQPNHSQ